MLALGQHRDVLVELLQQVLRAAPRQLSDATPLPLVLNVEDRVRRFYYVLKHINIAVLAI